MSEKNNFKLRTDSARASGNIITARFGRKARKLETKTSRRILLLQGPVGPFFDQLQTALDNNGYDAWRICFTAGDRLFSNRTKRITFSQGVDQWPSWLDQFLAYSDVDCIVLFGCERPIHSAARSLAKKRNIPVISLEEGYIRPGYITVEQDGNNRLSPLAGKLPEKSFEAPSSGKQQRSYPDSFSRMCSYGLLYYTINLLSSFSQRGTFHKRRPITGEAFFWGRNFVRKIAHQGKNFRTIEKLLEHHDKKFFVVPLQVSDDSQLKEAANGWTNEKLIVATLSSFAVYAAPSKRLVFKVHPLERGHSGHEKLIRSLCKLHGVEDRVDIIDTGSLGLLVRHSIGVITINSTSGLSAIAHSVPLLVAGQALYSGTKFAKTVLDNKDFDEFWRSNSSPDRADCAQYLAWLREKSLKSGDYYACEGILGAVQGVVDKIRILAPAENKNPPKAKRNNKGALLLSASYTARPPTETLSERNR